MTGPSGKKQAYQFPSNRAQVSALSTDINSSNTKPLPSAPTIFRYTDDFTNTKKSITFEDPTWKFRVDGRNATINWEEFSLDEVEILKRYFVWCVSEYDASTVLHFANMLRPHKSFIKAVIDAFNRPVIEAKGTWETTLTVDCSNHLAGLARSFARFLCSQSHFSWTTDDREYVKSWNWFGNGLHGARADEHTEFRLSSDAERSIISYIQSIAQLCKTSSHEETATSARQAAILYWVFQHCFRPIQIASLDLNDVTIRYDKNGQAKSAHATFYKVKQRDDKKRTPMRRKMKSQWATILDTVVKHRSSSNKKFERANSLFGMTPPEVSHEIRQLTFDITGSYISATDLRHNAAQRLADSGATSLQLSEFMGHSDEDTCLIYFEDSPSQGAKVNAALGMSPIYKRVHEISKQTYISPEQLDELPDEKQIGGANHGIAFAGIGGCTLGQNLCELSPAISCYNCPKFLPINDADFHDFIGNELRDVVKKFSVAGRNDNENPAFVQLRRTLERIAEITNEIRDQK